MNDMNPFNGGAVTRPAETAPAATDQQRAIAEVQAAMMIARANPRDELAAMDRILNACARPTLAQTALYSYVRGGATVTGPSIRLAEAIAQAWGNISFGWREMEQAHGFSTIQTYAWDIETNTRQERTFRIPLTRHTKKGSYALTDSRDIYELAANQASRRVRACILSIIPGDVVEAAVGQCEATLEANADTGPEAIKKLLAAFEGIGVNRAQIEARIGRRLASIEPAQMIQMRKIFLSIRDGMSSVDDWFDRPDGGDDGEGKGAAGASQTDKIKAALARKPTEKPASKPAARRAEARDDEDPFTAAPDDQEMPGDPDEYLTRDPDEDGDEHRRTDLED